MSDATPLLNGCDPAVKRTTIYQKLDVANRLELYVYATKHGL